MILSIVLIIRTQFDIVKSHQNNLFIKTLKKFSKESISLFQWFHFLIFLGLFSFFSLVYGDASFFIFSSFYFLILDFPR